MANNNGRNMNIGNQNVVGNAKEEYDIASALKEQSSQLKTLISLMGKLTKTTGDYGETAKKAFSHDLFSSSIRDTDREYDKLTQKFDREYEKDLARRKKEEDWKKHIAELEKEARTSENKYRVTRLKQIKKELEAAEEQKKLYKEVFDKATGKSKGVYTALGGEINKKTGHVYTAGEELSKELSESINYSLNAQITSLENEALKIQEEFGEKNVSATTKALDGFKKAGTKILGELKSEVTKGMNDFVSSYESNFTMLAGVTGTGGNRAATRQIFSDTQSAAKQYGAALNYNNDVLQQTLELAKAGIQGQDLTARSITAAVDQKIMPWLSETSQTWITISSQMDDQTERQYKNMQLSLQNSTSGNRLLQTGVIDKLNADIYPVLENIDFNTVDKGSLPTEMLALMQTYIDQGFSENEAYQAAKDAYDISGDLYGALTSGNVSKIVQAQNQMQYGLGKGALMTQDYFTKMMAGAGSDVGASAIANIYNARGYLKGQYATVENARSSALDFGAYDRNFADLQIASQSDKELKEREKNLDQYNTITQHFKNYVENFGSAIGKFVSAVPGGDMLASMGGEIAGEVVGHLLNKGLDKLGGKLFGKAAKEIGEEAVKKVGGEAIKKIGGEAIKQGASSSLSSIGSTLATGLSKGGIAAGGGATATAALAGVAGLAAGAIMMGKDAQKAAEKAKDWGTSEGSAKMAGVFFGAEEQPSLKNTAKQMAKYGAIGAGIGSFIPGVGTVIGGAVGAGVGALSSVVNGKDVAKWIDKQKETHADNKAFRRQLKLAKAEGKGNENIVKKILDSVTNIEKDISNSAGNNAKNGILKLGGLLSGDENNDIYSTIKNGILMTNPLGLIAKGLSLNANNNKDDKKDKADTLTFGESQIVDTIKEIGENIVKAINAINPTKNDIDYANGLFRATNKGMTYNSMVNLWSDTQKEDTTTA